MLPVALFNDTHGPKTIVFRVFNTAQAKTSSENKYLLL